MAIYGETWAMITTPGGSDPNSASVTWRWPSGVKIKAQAAVTGFGTGGDAWFRFGFSSYVRSGHHETLRLPVPVFFMDDVTELEISATTNEGWVNGGATGLLWE